jgi:hypothetical protein
LPGNFYQLYSAKERQFYSAYYLDMKSSHHTLAQRIEFPDPDTLYARGYFRVDETGIGKPWLRNGTPAFRDFILNARGLLWAYVTTQEQQKERFPLPALMQGGSRMMYLYTNEVAYLRELGAHIDWISAAWTSPNQSSALNQYATWALEELSLATDTRRAWLKPTLLATYGVLAARPRPTEFGYKRAVGGERREYPAGSGVLEATSKRSLLDVESSTANVIYRGLIEAEQRVEALRLAQYVTQAGCNVLAIYADSVFVQTPCELPLLPAPWRIEAELDRLSFMSATTFTSRQLSKLPGIPRADAERLRRLQQISAARV